MDEQRKRLLLKALPAFVPMPPDHTLYSKQQITNLMMIANIPPSPTTDVRFRNFSEDNNTYKGIDVFTAYAGNWYQFFQCTGETPETLIELETLICLSPDRHRILTARNRAYFCL
ncbi:hypothetical protein ACF0H5_010139 [Mactra antiquata]